jgi:hypothetical protein
MDNCGAAVYDAVTLEHVADLHGKWPFDEFAKRLFDLGVEYGNALLGVERNNHGHVILTLLNQLGYPNVYVHNEARLGFKAGRGHTLPKPGWPTDVRTKPIMEARLESLIESFGFVSHDEDFWDEVLSYVYLGPGKAGAQAGTHDDRVIKHMIALCILDSGQNAGVAGGVVSRGNPYIAGRFEVING